MATKRKSKISEKKSVSTISSTASPSNDTKIIIVILLLLFAYPLGLIFMWGWMKNWPIWLKVVLSVPLILAILFIVAAFSFIGNAIHNRRYDNSYQRKIEQMNNESDGNSNIMDVSPTTTIIPQTTY